MKSPLGPSTPLPLVFKDEKGEEKAISWQQVWVTVMKIPRLFWPFVVLILIGYASYDEVLFRLYEAEWLEGSAIGGIDAPSNVTGLSRKNLRDDKVCVVVRFGADQIDDEKYNLVHTIDSIAAQDHKNWEMVLIATDNGDISSARHLVNSYPSEISSRLRMYQLHWVLEKYNPAYKARFHKKVYRFTDYAISKCSSDNKWVLVTNGDNTYQKSFLSYLNPSYDIVAFDFYSRWYMDQSKFKPCERLGAVLYKDTDGDIDSYPEPKYIPDGNRQLASCLKNHVRKAATDLGANVLNFRRWNEEGRKYRKIHSIDGSQDGFMMELLKKAEWTVLNIGGSFTPAASQSQRALQEVNPEREAAIANYEQQGGGGRGGEVEKLIGMSLDSPSGEGTPHNAGSLQECLFDHNPNYHSCLALGPQWIWDDSALDCITTEKAEALLAIGRYASSTGVSRCISEDY